MDAKKIGDFRQRLLGEKTFLVQMISRNRFAAKELVVEHTEDEYDLATISQNRELLYDLSESDFQRLRSIEEALQAMDKGQYGDCVRCAEEIKERRLMAVPWTRLCIRCQEENEAHQVSSQLVSAGNDEGEWES